MAMSIPILTTAIRDALIVAYRNPSGGANDDTAFLNSVSQALATAIINHITTYAQCDGVDSRGDSHSTVGII